MTGRAKAPKKRARPLSVAITGGIGAGKSELLRAFARLGVPTLSADEVVHDLISDDPDVRAALEQRFGSNERGRIAEVVFSDRSELAWLEALLHPRVFVAVDRWREGQGADVVVIEAPLLYEGGGEGRYDAVVAVTAPADVRAARTSVRKDSRADRLIPDDEKMGRADFAFVNDGSLEELEQFAASVLEALERW